MKSRIILIVAIAALVQACTVGPEPERPRTAADEAERFVHADEQLPVQSLSPWWLSFADQATVELVDMALAENTDIRVAAANVLEARASLRSARSSLWPRLDWSVNASKSETAFNLPGQGLISVEATNYSAEIGASYQVDLFGKLKRTRQSAWSSVLAQEATAETITHSVISAVVRARVQVATLQRSLRIAREIRESWQRTLDNVERRYRLGLVQPMELHLARENLAAVEGNEIRLRAALQQARHALDVLVGRRPGSGTPLPDTFPDLPDLEPVPTGVPADLLDRRPDLRANELQVITATYGVGVAIADLYPNLSLSGSYGTRSERFSDVVDLDNAVYQLVANLLGPLFEGGARRAEVEAAEARLRAASAKYAGNVLVAMAEVEDALVADQANADQITHSRTRLDEARAADRLARDRYQRGVTNLLTVLETERRVRAAEEAHMTALSEAWNTRIDLFLALGGDWKRPADDRRDSGPEDHQREVS